MVKFAVLDQTLTEHDTDSVRLLCALPEGMFSLLQSSDETLSAPSSSAISGIETWLTELDGTFANGSMLGCLDTGSGERHVC